MLKTERTMSRDVVGITDLRDCCSTVQHLDTLGRWANQIHQNQENGTDVNVSAQGGQWKPKLQSEAGDDGSREKNSGVTVGDKLNELTF